MQRYTFFLFILGVFISLLGFPLLSPGALFVLDFTPLPFTQWQEWYATTIQWHIVDALRYILGYSITSKIYFCIVYAVGIFAGICIGNSLSRILKTQETSKIFILRAVSILFILCNPWTYERIVTQPGIAMGMFSLGICLAFLIENIYFKKKGGLLKVSIAAAFAFLFFPHASVMLICIALLYSIFYFKKIEKTYFLVAPLIILLINANWLIGDLFYQEKDIGINSIQSFDRANIEGFVGNSLSGLGTEVTHLLLYGFWGEKYHILTPEKFNAYWYIFGFFGLGIVIYGNIILYKQEKRLWGFLTLLCVVSYILALGISSPISTSLSNFLYENIPGYIGMREPQKWLGLTMICYAYFFGVTIFQCIEKRKYIQTWLIISGVFTLLNTWNPMNLWAYQGQLLGVTIPQEYFEARDFLTNKKINEKVLVVPWHTYMSCSWTRGKVIATSQKNMFYPLPVVVSDNIEIGTKYSNSSSSISQDIEKYLKNKDISILKKQDLEYILLVKNCASEEQFKYLKEEKEKYTLVYSNTDINIYSIPHEDNK